MGKVSINNLDYRQMFNVAKEFSEAAARLAENNSLIEQGWTRPLIIPEIVNIAFSCEVFLKSLLVFSEIEFGKEHELKELWSLIPPSLKDDINNEITLMGIEFEDENGFNDLLERSSNAFAKWRYIYEFSGLSGYPGFLRAFSDALREVCCQKYHNSTWEEYKKML